MATRIRNINGEIRVPLNYDEEDLRATFTEEGFFRDTPIVTRIGVFEYWDKDEKKIRRELRLPEDVFDPASLDSYAGKPIILTHAGGHIDVDNVMDEEVGVILEPGFRDGNYVRAKIVIHDVKSALEDNHTRELSLGYSRDLEMKSGVWNGHPYDGIQRNIRINHLAIVEDARAGSAARLNIDSNDIETIEISDEGGNSMTRNNSEAISPEELQKQIDGFMAKNSKADADDTPNEAELKANGENSETPKPETNAAVSKAEGTAPEAKEGEAGVEPKDPKALTPAEIIESVRQKQDCKDSEEPEDLKAALDEKNKDIKALLDAIDSLEAVKDLEKGQAKQDCKDGEEEPAVVAVDCNKADCKTDCKDPADCNNLDGDIDEGADLTQDAVDKRVNEKIKAIRIGDKLNMDGLESLSLIEIKKAIIKKYDPKMVFDGKSKGYIEAAYNFVVDKLGDMRKDANYQRAQMMGFGMNLDASDSPKERRTAAQARKEMENALYSAKNEGGNK